MCTPFFNRVILKDGVSFVNWRADLRAELSRADVLGHVFHDIRGIDPEIEPEEPQSTKAESSEDFDQAMRIYKNRLRAWIKGEMVAQNSIIQRLDDSKKPFDYHKYTAKQLYDMVARSNELRTTLPYSEAFDLFISTTFTTTAEEYCTRFLQNLQNVNDAAGSLFPGTPTKYMISDELASVYFVKGTKNVKWLDPWRNTKAMNISQYAPLHQMISTLKATAGTRILGNENPIASAAGDPPVSAAPRNPGNEPQTRHKKIRNKHKNKEFFKQPVEKAPLAFLKSDDEGSEKIPHRSRNKGRGTIIQPFTGSMFDSDNDGHIFIM